MTIKRDEQHSAMMIKNWEITGTCTPLAGSTMRQNPAHAVGHGFTGDHQRLKHHVHHESHGGANEYLLHNQHHTGSDTGSTAGAAGNNGATANSW